jgi:Trypsin-co-occurring domain 1
MSRYLQMSTPGGELLVETGDDGDILENSEGLESAGVSERLPSFEEASTVLKKNAEYLLNIMRELSPDEVVVSCGITAGAEGGNTFWGLAKVSGQASYTLTIKWKAG